MTLAFVTFAFVTFAFVTFAFVPFGVAAKKHILKLVVTDQQTDRQTD